MKPFYTKAASDFDPSIIMRYVDHPDLQPIWHYHDEYELVYIHKSKGVRYVGDNVSVYQAGDLVLLGSKLPHTWIDDKNLNSSDQYAATVIHFQRKFIHNDFFDLLLMKEIKNLFLRSKQGIQFIRYKNIEQTLKKIQEAQTGNKVSLVIDLLQKLSKSRNAKLLSSKNYALSNFEQQDEKLMKIHNFIIQNYRKHITLEELSDIANMTPQALCHFFKSKNRKTIFTYINELRIGYASKMLFERDFNVDRIAMECGFNNTTFFNRKFKELTRSTPREYRNQFRF